MSSWLSEFKMLQVNRRGESDSLKMLDSRFGESSPSQLVEFYQVGSKFNHLTAMPSSSCYMEELKLRNNANETGGSGDQLNGTTSRTTLSKIPKPAKSMTESFKIMEDERSKSKFESNQNVQSGSKVELRQWHKLMDNYERLQFVASSRAQNKLIDSTSESSDDMSSQASTVFETVPKGSDARRSDQNKEIVQELSGSVGQCLDELVEAVATKREPVPYKVFSLHEAVCAKTNSGSSATTTSASEDGSSCDETSRSCGRWPALNKVVVEFCARFELIGSDCELLDKKQILVRAREFARDSTKATSFALALGARGRSIECCDENNNKFSIDLNQVADCLQDEKIVVWLLHCQQTSELEVEQSNELEQGNELDLDDIALALNEPVVSKPHRQQAHPEALVWRCARGSRDAKRLQNVWLQYKIKCQNKQAVVKQMNLIEVMPDEMAVDSAVARQMRSNGLFVLQTGTSTGRSQTSLENRQLQIRKLADGAKVGEQSGGGSKSQLSASSLDSVNSRGNTGHKNAPVSIQTQTVACQQNGQVNQPNLANYYRNVASKVLSNSSNRLKNFTLESGQTLARGARRLSTAINQQMPTGSSGDTNKKSELNESEKVVPKAKPRTSVLKREKIGAFGVDQKRMFDSETERANDGPVVSGGQLGESYQDRATPATQSIKFAETTSGNIGAARCTSSVASRARQRRPALLLTRPSSNQFDDGEQEQPQANVSKSSQIDGTVRAKVSMAHLRRSASMKVLATENCVQADRVQQRLRQANNGDSESQTRKKSEFDPRSLRKLSCSETARALRGAPMETIAAISVDDLAGRNGTGASRDERRLMRDRVRRRKSMANLSELRSELEHDEAESATRSTGAESAQCCANSDATGSQKLGKNFNLLRQSFKQNNLSKAIMSFATNRQSLRVKRSSLADGGLRGNAVGQHEDEEVSPVDVWTRDGQKQQQQKRVDLLSSPSPRQQKLEAIELAEANLLAARQLKQQAQRLRELQIRSEQQPLQTQMVDQAAILFYNQHMQMQQQQQQQQQLIYQAQQQQHYAFSSGYSQHMFDPLTFYHSQQQQQSFAHQLQQNRQRQQQLAYLSNHSAHFMAASTAAAQHQMAFAHTAPATGDNLYPVGRMSSLALGSMPELIGQQLATPPLPLQQQTLQLDHNQPSALISCQQRSSMAKYQQQQHQQQVQQSAYLVTNNQRQFIPMSVNHHSSFNIVYTAAAAAAAAANQHHHQQQMAAVAASQHQANQFNISPYLTSFVESNQTGNQATMQQQFLTETVAQTEPRQSPVLRTKQSSLGASVRKTMRSILRNGKSVASYAVPSSKSRSSLPPPPVVQQPSGQPLKSALKASSALKEQHQLNSEGSDASDASSSLSSDFSSAGNEQIATSSKTRSKTSGLQAKQCSSSVPTSYLVSSSTSSSSSSPTSSSHSSLASAGTPTKRELEELGGEFAPRSAGSITSSSNSATQTADNGHERRTEAKRLAAGKSRASLCTAAVMANQRKNVTFSTKLTSIL